MKKVLEHQLWHFLCLSCLLMVIYFYAKFDASIFKGELLGLKTSAWFLIAILSPILHQVYVLICWRLELYHNSITNTFGEIGFTFYKIGFAILFASRLFTIIFLAVANADTILMNQMFGYALAGLLLIPSVYLFYSVKKYFGYDRAFGIDHFQPEIFKNESFVKKGIFRYSSNAMYVYGFAILYIPGFIFMSKAAILVAVFNHVYIWVHYYFTESPDMKVIYGEK